MKRVLIELTVSLPDDYSELKLDRHLADSLLDAGAGLIESRPYIEERADGNFWMSLEHQIIKYNEYIQDANDEDRYAEGWYPVCFSEFVHNEYKEMYEEFLEENNEGE